MNVTILAERATLGSLMTTPDAAAAVRWLRSSDFFDPWHEQVHRVIKELAVAGEPVNPELVGRALLNRLSPARANVVRLTDLLRATPTRPEPALYGAMVLEAAIRRETAGQGVLVRAGALAAALDGTPRPLLAVAAMVTATLDAHESRWRSAVSGPHTRLDDLSDPVQKAEPNRLDVGWAREHGRSADRLLRTHPALDPQVTAEREADLIAALIARPHQIGPVRGWLRPEALTNEAWRPVYRSLLTLVDRGRPIDAVTALWEAEHTRPPEEPPLDAKPVVARVETASSMQPEFLARQVAADHLRLVADHAARGLYAAADNPALDVEQLLGAAHTHLARVCTAVQPLTAAAPAPRRPGVAQLRPALVHPGSAVPALVRGDPVRGGPVRGDLDPGDRLRGPVAG